MTSTGPCVRMGEGTLCGTPPLPTAGRPISSEFWPGFRAKKCCLTMWHFFRVQGGSSYVSAYSCHTDVALGTTWIVLGFRSTCSLAVLCLPPQKCLTGGLRATCLMGFHSPYHQAFGVTEHWNNLEKTESKIFLTLIPLHSTSLHILTRHFGLCNSPRFGWFCERNDLLPATCWIRNKIK